MRTIETAYRNTRYLRLVVDIAEMIGIAVLSEGIATVASGAARGAVLGGAAVDTVEFARTAALARGVGTATALTTDVAVQSLGQMVVDGHSSFGEAALTNVITLGALRPFHAWVGKLGQVDAETRGLWKLASGGKVVLAETGKFTVETLVGAGASYVATRIVEGKAPPDSLTAASWAAQGASMAVGKFVHGRMRDLNERWAKFGEEKIALLKRARGQEQLAENLQKTGQTESALYLLEEHANVLQQERTLLSDPDAVQRLQLDSGQLHALQRGNMNAIAETQTQAYGFMRLRFQGLEPLTNRGDVWAGTQSQIQAVLTDAGGALRDVAPAGEGQWTARMAGADIKFTEISHWHVDPKDIKHARQRGDDGHEYQYDAMHPGPLSNRRVYDPNNTGEPLPAQNFYGGKYDESVLPEDTVLYRVGNAEREWGEWFTDHPLEGEAQYRIDVAVKREWSNPATGTVRTGSLRGSKELELWSYSILIPKGTRVYSGPSGSQGGVFMGGLSAGSRQYFIPNPRKLISKGARVIAKKRAFTGNQG